MNLATMTNSGRSSIAKAISERTLHLAWGTGKDDWDKDNQYLKEILINKTSLENEIGRRLINFVGFATPNENGDITVPAGFKSDGDIEINRYESSKEPTPYLYMNINFDYKDATNQIIREVAIFMDTKALDEIPKGQRYLKPEEVADKGQLLVIQRLDPVIKRSPSIRQTFEFVLPI